MREVDVPGVWRHVRTLGHVAHVAQVTVVDDVPVNLLVHAVELEGRGCVYRVKQSWKGVAEAETAATSVADVENALQLLFQGSCVVELGVTPIQWMAGGSFEAALAATARRTRCTHTRGLAGLLA